jgi:hypothetical protein
MNKGMKGIGAGLNQNYTLQAISKKPFGPISLLEAKFKSSEYLSMPPV